MIPQSCKTPNTAYFPIQNIIGLLILCALLAPSLVQAQQTYKKLENISYRSAKEVRADDYMKERCVLDFYYPQDKSNFATVVWFHGGGLTEGNKYIPKELMEQGFAVVTVNYRLAPKVQAPVCIDDAAAAVAWVFEHVSEYGGDPAKIYLSGHSAGGYLATMIGIDKSYLSKYAVDADRVKAYLPLSGQMLTHYTLREQQGLQKNQISADKYAPLFHVRADMPPIVLITGDRKLELPARYEENALFFATMKDAGHPDIVQYELDGFNHNTMVAPASMLISHYIRKQEQADKK